MAYKVPKNLYLLSGKQVQRRNTPLPSRDAASTVVSYTEPVWGHAGTP